MIRNILYIVPILAVLISPAWSQSARRQGTSAANLTNTPQVLLPQFPQRRLLFCVIQGGVANEDVIFRGVGGTPVYATVTVNAGELLARSLNVVIPTGGLEVVTASAAGDVAVECTYRLQ